MERPQRKLMRKKQSSSQSYWKIIFLVVFLVALAGISYYVFFTDTKSPMVDLPKTTETPKAAEVPKPVEVVPPKSTLEDSAPKTSAKGEHIIIDKSDYKLYFMNGEKVVKSYDIAVGKNTGDKQKAGDMRTPNGPFKVDEIIDSSYWTHDFGDGKGEIAGAYGPWFISLITGWDGIGIHGTHDPSSIRTNASEGCVRMYNEDLKELKQRIPIGLSVEIRE